MWPVLDKRCSDKKSFFWFLLFRLKGNRIMNFYISQNGLVWISLNEAKELNPGFLVYNVRGISPVRPICPFFEGFLDAFDPSQVKASNQEKTKTLSSLRIKCFPGGVRKKPILPSKGPDQDKTKNFIDNRLTRDRKNGTWSQLEIGFLMPLNPYVVKRRSWSFGSWKSKNASEYANLIEKKWIRE